MSTVIPNQFIINLTAHTQVVQCVIAIQNPNYAAYRHHEVM